MKTCEIIQEKLVGGEELAPPEQSHVGTCDDCRSFQTTARAIARSGEVVRSMEEVPAEVTRAVKGRVAERLRPKRTAVRLAWASAAMLVGILGAVLVLSGVFGPDESNRTEESFAALLDDVSEITRLDTEETAFDVADTALYSVALFFEEEIAPETTDIELPGAYEILEEGLQEG